MYSLYGVIVSLRNKKWTETFSQKFRRQISVNNTQGYHSLWSHCKACTRYQGGSNCWWYILKYIYRNVKLIILRPGLRFRWRCHDLWCWPECISTNRNSRVYKLVGPYPSHFLYFTLSISRLIQTVVGFILFALALFQSAKQWKLMHFKGNDLKRVLIRDQIAYYFM